MSTPEQIKAAEGTLMPWGRYGRKTLGELADADLRYLDWLAGIDIKDVRVRDAVRTVAEDRRQEIADLLASEDAENESHGQRRTE